MSKNNDSFKLLYIFCFIVISLWLSAFFILKDVPNKGVIGDMFGGVNALFSGLALAGIIFTILLQKKELGLQRLELSETRKEFKIQNETLKLQRFENTFFQLISNYHQIIDKLELREYFDGNEYISTKRVVFQRISTDLKAQFRGSPKFNDQSDSIELISERLKNSIKNFYEVNENYEYGYYFDNIFQTLEFIRISKSINDEERVFYRNLFRSQLSSDEIFVLFYHCLRHEVNSPNFIVSAHDSLLFSHSPDFGVEEFDLHQEVFKKCYSDQKKIILKSPLITDIRFQRI
ncbi:MAG: putative phage abortive infection protein [Cyclobacteriaceae bacterium]